MFKLLEITLLVLITCLTLLIQLIITSFFLGKQKKEISQKRFVESRDGEESKKVKQINSLSFLPGNFFFRWFKFNGTSKVNCKLFKKYKEPSKEAFHFPQRGKGISNQSD